MGLGQLFKKKQNTESVDDLKKRFSQVTQAQSQGGGQQPPQQPHGGQDGQPQSPQQPQTPQQDQPPSSGQPAQGVQAQQPQQAQPQNAQQAPHGAQGGEQAHPQPSPAQGQQPDVQDGQQGGQQDVTVEDSLSSEIDSEIEQVVLEQGTGEEEETQQGDFSRSKAAQYLDEVRSNYEDSKLLNMVIEQVKELIEIDNNLNHMIKENERAITTERNEREKLQKKIDQQFLELKKMEKNMSKFIGLYEVVTNRFNPFLEGSDSESGVDIEGMQSTEDGAELGQAAEGGAQASSASDMFHKLKSQQSGEGEEDENEGSDESGEAAQEGSDAASLFHKMKAEKEKGDGENSGGEEQQGESQENQGEAQQQPSQPQDQPQQPGQPAQQPQSGQEQDQQGSGQPSQSQEQSGSQQEQPPQQSQGGQAQQPQSPPQNEQPSQPQQPQQAPGQPSQSQDQSGSQQEQQPQQPHAQQPQQEAQHASESLQTNQGQGQNPHFPQPPEWEKQSPPSSEESGGEQPQQQVMHAADGQGADTDGSRLAAEAGSMNSECSDVNASVVGESDVSSQEGAAMRSQVVEQLGLPHTKKVPDGLEFKAFDGQRISSLSQMLAFLIETNDDVFNNHVTPYKNDFSAWVYHVMHNDILSEKLSASRSRSEMVAVLTTFLRS